MSDVPIPVEVVAGIDAKLSNVCCGTRHYCYDDPLPRFHYTMKDLRDAAADSTAIESRVTTVNTTIAAATTLSSPANAKRLLLLHLNCCVANCSYI